MRRLYGMSMCVCCMRVSVYVHMSTGFRTGFTGWLGVSRGFLVEFWQWDQGVVVIRGVDVAYIEVNRWLHWLYG
jgi:hypothetical protein